MSETPDVSVVLAVRDGAAHLSDALDSVLGQTGPALEVVVVDDGSQDETGGLLAEYSGRDPRVRILEQPAQGLTRALIRGVAGARGRYVARQDADDRSLPGRLERQAGRLDADPGLAFVASAFRYVGPHGERLTDTSPIEDPDAATGRLLNPSRDRLAIPRHGSVMFRKAAYEAAGGYRSQFYFAQDLELWTRLAEVGKLGYVEDVLYEVRFDYGSLTALYGAEQRLLRSLVIELVECRRNGRSEEPVLARAAAVVPRRRSARRLRARAAYFIGSCLAARRDARAREYLWTATRLDPLHVKAWWKLARRCWETS